MRMCAYRSVVVVIVADAFIRRESEQNKFPSCSIVVVAVVAVVAFPPSIIIIIIIVFYVLFLPISSLCFLNTFWFFAFLIK